MRTIIGVLFISLIMTPGEMYLGLVTGGGLGQAAQWVTVILFLEVAKRSFTSLKRQEIYLLVYVAGALVAREEGAFLDLLWRQYFVRSPEAEQFGVAEILPFWWGAGSGFGSPCPAHLHASRLGLADRPAHPRHHRRAHLLVHVGLCPVSPDIRSRTAALPHGAHVGVERYGPGRGERGRAGDLEVANFQCGRHDRSRLRRHLRRSSDGDGNVWHQSGAHPDSVRRFHTLFRQFSAGDTARGSLSIWGPFSPAC